MNSLMQSQNLKSNIIDAYLNERFTYEFKNNCVSSYESFAMYLSNHDNQCLINYIK